MAFRLVSNISCIFMTCIWLTVYTPMVCSLLASRPVANMSCIFQDVYMINRLIRRCSDVVRCMVYVITLQIYFIWLMVFNATLSLLLLFVPLSFYWWKKPECPDRTTYLNVSNESVLLVGRLQSRGIIQSN